jgi:hypothetical protein
MPAKVSAKHRADRERRLHPVDLDPPEHLDALGTETAGPPDGVDRLSLVGALVEKVPDV